MDTYRPYRPVDGFMEIILWCKKRPGELEDARASVCAYTCRVRVHVGVGVGVGVHVRVRVRAGMGAGAGVGVGARA